MKILFYISTFCRSYAKLVYYVYIDLFDPDALEADQITRFEWLCLIFLAPLIAIVYAFNDTKDYMDNFIDRL